jgi:hypothetical protein
MSPLEPIVLIGIILAFTSFVVILALVSRADPVLRRVAVNTHPAAPHDRLRPV